ncbi:MAG: hypothetical protein AAGC65_20870, partial [Mucilaginibacter sp.]|uniref:hypothetical protein n=1 Tax=Mucilaginibacter sp. TaxID=1882438 RepID=UPI0031AAD316
MKHKFLAGHYLYGAACLLAVLGSSCATKKQAANQTLTLKTSSGPAGTTATATVGAPKKEGIKKFSDLITGKVKAD